MKVCYKIHETQLRKAVQESGLSHASVRKATNILKIHPYCILTYLLHAAGYYLKS